MIGILFAILISSLLVVLPAPAADKNAPVPLLWCGLDYSLVKMIGTRDFRRPDTIFPGMLNEWNSLFITEMLPKLEAMTKSLSSDLSAVRSNNGKANRTQIISQDGTKGEMVDVSHIGSADLAKLVADYDLKQKEGVGLVFVVDRLVKAQETECLYVVFFDLSSKRIISSARVVEKAGGFSFRNYWFSPIKKTLDELPKTYKKILKARATK